MNNSREPERIRAEPGDEDAWHCICGNYPSGGGFSPCDARGIEMEPDADSDWNGLYICCDCGRIIDQRTRIVVGINPDWVRPE
jgi:hypothetical protein